MSQQTAPPGPVKASPTVARLGAFFGALLLVVMAFGIGRCTAGAGESDSDEHGGHDQSGDVSEWTCSMHPQIRQPEAGDCPICGMDLIPVAGNDDDSLAPNRVSLSPRAQALARVRTTEVTRRSGDATAVRLLGRVDYDETTLQSVTAWVGGRIERLHVTTTGERVRRGQTVATLYSPEVYSAQQDLIAARRQLERLSAASELAQSAARSSLESARQRLRLLGVPESTISTMESADSPNRRLTIRTPFAGTVIEREAVQGAYVETGTVLYRIADLTRLWVQLDAYESDLGNLFVGQTVDIEVDAFPGQRFEGRISFMDPVIDPRRRTARVRVALSNPDRRLRPGMFVQANVSGVESGDAQPLLIPAAAALFTGRRSVVYVEVPNAARPTYEARVVRLGPRVGDWFPVVAGLREGDKVVAHGAFALDADLQIRGGESMMMGGDDTTERPFDQLIEVPALWNEALAPVVEAYLEVQVALANDDAAGAKTGAARLNTAVLAFSPEEPADAVDAWEQMAGHLQMHAQSAGESETIESLRTQFEPLSMHIAALLRTFGNPTSSALRIAHCPMAFDSRGAEWIQASDDVDNAYFGSAMRTCGTIRSTVEPGEYLSTTSSGDAPERARPAMTGHNH